MCRRSCPVKLCIRNVPDDDGRGPKVTGSLTVRQAAEYLLPAGASVRDLIFSVWPLYRAAAFQPRLTAGRGLEGL